jgi:hypothetical protein
LGQSFFLLLCSVQKPIRDLVILGQPATLHLIGAPLKLTGVGSSCCFPPRLENSRTYSLEGVSGGRSGLRGSTGSSNSVKCRYTSPRTYLGQNSLCTASRVRFDLVFPDFYYLPAHRLQFFSVKPVPLDVPCELAPPERGVGLRK